MSKSRDIIDQSLNENKQNKTFLQMWMEAAFIGAVVGPLSSTATFAIDKASFVFQTSQSPNLNFRKAVSLAMENKFTGYGFTIFNSGCKNMVLFPIKENIESYLNTHNPGSSFNAQLAGFTAGMFATGIMSPLSVLKTRRFDGMPLNKIFSLDKADYYKGLFATCLRDGIYSGTYFGLRPIMSYYALNSTLMNYVSEGMANIGIDMMAGVVGGFLSNPLSVIATNQKAYGTKFFEQAKKLHNEDGVKRFFRGYASTTFFRMAIQGLVTGQAIELATTMQDKYSTCKS